MAFVIGDDPVAVAERVSTQQFRVIAVIVGRQRTGGGDGTLKRLRIVVSHGGRRAQKMDVRLEHRFHRERRPRGITDPRLAARQERREITDCLPHVARRRCHRGAGDHPDAKFAQRAALRRRKRDTPCASERLVRCGQHLHCNFEVVRAARQRPGDEHVQRRVHARQRVARGRHDAERRLVAVHASEVRRIANRATDVAADFQCAEPGCKRGRSPAG